MLHDSTPSLCLHAALHHRCMHAVPSAGGSLAVWVQSILDLRVMTRDCKKEARHFDNGLQELAYDAAQVCDGASSPLAQAHLVCSTAVRELYGLVLCLSAMLQHEPCLAIIVCRCTMRPVSA